MIRVEPFVSLWPSTRVAVGHRQSLGQGLGNERGTRGEKEKEAASE